MSNTALLEQYYECGEFGDLANAFEVAVTLDHMEELITPESRQWWLLISTKLIKQIEQGNARALLETLAEQLDIRNANAVASTD